MQVMDRGMAVALRTLRRVAGVEALDRFGLRQPLERAVHAAAKQGATAAGTAGRAFSSVGTRLSKPARQTPVRRRELFDLTPTDEQQMLVEAFRAFAAERLRPAAAEADADCSAPQALLAQVNELGVLQLAAPTELGGYLEERSSVTSVLAAEALAHGDLGLAVACLSPAAVGAALSLWGDAEQQATYLTDLTGDDPPVASLAVMEPRPLFDPFQLSARARRHGGDLVLDGVKSLVPRGAQADLLLVAVDLEGSGPALVLVEAADGVLARPAPAMGVRAAATAEVVLDGVRVPDDRVLADGDPGAYAEAIHRSRMGWCALAVGASQAVLDYVIPYVNTREAFGEPVSNRQSVAFAVSDIAIELEGMRLLTYRAASLADAGRPFAREAAMARTLCASKAMAIGSDGVQLLGGHGYVKEHPVERWYRDLRAIGLAEGGVLL